MGVSFGNISVNGRSVSGGNHVNGKQLKCPDDGNTTSWGDITISGGKAEADCGVCGKTVKI